MTDLPAIERESVTCASSAVEEATPENSTWQMSMDSALLITQRYLSHKVASAPFVEESEDTTSTSTMTMRLKNDSSRKDSIPWQQRGALFGGFYARTVTREYSRQPRIDQKYSEQQQII